ncbi:hypothetical protein [Actinomadura sp. DC4]|uniref:hypothetical protein n=1 Tax=Actinomadura sp. DC4 TaxID=3055069 RepID=UPI0025B06E6E|nr:hypothetical protein [Actinomadura sp. DC4]MDN3351701.1 hypothetical protein [Actinomadura sp. DC4]
MSPSEPRKWPWQQPTTNTASGNATIGVQGTVIGDVRYEVAGDDPPDRKYEVAKSCLAGKMPRRAKQLIEEAVIAGLVADGARDPLVNEVAYYWTIAALSDQSFELLEKEEFADLERAGRLGRNGPPDDWRRARQTITRLIACLQSEETSGTLDAEALDGFFTEFDRLSYDRRDEIRRHLDLILTGVIQDRLDARFAEIVRTQRTAGHREHRVWKYFEPEPEAPRPKVLRRPEWGPFERTATVCGAAMCLAGLGVAFTLAGLSSVTTTLLAAGGILLSCALIAYFAPEQLPARYSALHPKRPRPAPTAFSDHVGQSVERQFDKQAPRSFGQRSAWRMATLRFRSTLANEIVDLYSEPEVAFGAIDWLIAWYAAEAAREWSAGGLDDRERPFKILALLAGGLGLCFGGFYALSEASETQAGITLITVVWLAIGVVFLAWGRADVRLVRRYDRAERAEAQRRLTEEKAAYEARLAVLADRPDDDEMARWLDYDKIYLKTLAMNQYGLANRDVIAHAILPEATPNARRARVVGGQPRFSAYVVWVFLLTMSGARQVAVKLDFPTGIASDQDRRAFRYDAIASANVTESGIRFDDGRREVILPHPHGEQRAPQVSSLIFRQRFSLSLTNNETIVITVENFDAALLPQRPGDDEPRATPDLADLTGALSLLEAVAADGRKWIEQARIRHGYKPVGDEYEPDSPDDEQGGG